MNNSETSILDLTLLKNMNVLIVEDDEAILNNICQSLQLLFAHVYKATNGIDAYSLYKKHKPHFILSDISMPYEDGLTFIENIREQDTQTPVIIFSAFSSEEFLLRASNLQIDGYIVKPLSLDKLLPPIFRAMKRLNHTQILPKIINIHPDFQYDLSQQKLSQNQKEISLGKKERLLFNLLCKQTGNTVNKEEISRQVWKNEFMTESAMKNLIASCRKKTDKNSIASDSCLGWRINHF
jgi:two-component system, OmpR family, response regulator VanR